MCFLGKHDKNHFESLGHDIPFCRPRQMEQADNQGILWLEEVHFFWKKEGKGVM